MMGQGLNSPQKKLGTSKGERVEGFLDANAINDKAVYCYAVLVATSHHTTINNRQKKALYGGHKGL